MRFGPAIFEAHVRTTVRENYFKWIFQQLSDIHEVEDKDVDEFQMEYDENVYTDLPRTLACTHKELTKFPFKNYEIDYQDNDINEKETEEDDNDSYCSANSVDPTDQSEGRNQSTASGTGNQDSVGKKFVLVYKNADNNRFCEIRDKQRREIRSVIEKKRDQYKDILDSLKGTIQKIREVKRNIPETDPMHKAAIAEAKKNLRLFKDPYEQDVEAPVKKKRRRSIENQTRFSDSKVTFFSKANEEMKEEEKQGLRKSWESLYKEIWNKHLLLPKNPIIDVPIPQVDCIIRDMESDVNQLLADCAGMVEEV
jgi:hypothetical protein